MDKFEGGDTHIWEGAGWDYAKGTGILLYEVGSPSRHREGFHRGRKARASTFCKCSPEGHHTPSTSPSPSHSPHP